jgi:hypothetical protein
VLNTVFDVLANKNRSYQYACERFWGPIAGIEEVVLTMRAIKTPAKQQADGARA